MGKNKKILRETIDNCNNSLVHLVNQVRSLEQSIVDKIPHPNYVKSTNSRVAKLESLNSIMQKDLNLRTELANRYKGELEQWTNRCIQAEGRRDELEVAKKQLEDKINSCLVFRYGDYTIIDTLERDVSALEDLLDNKTPHHLEKTRLGGKIEGVKLALQKIKEYQKIEAE